MIAVDVSEEMVEQARALHDDRPAIDFRVGDGRSVPVDDDTADLVFSYVVFQHMPSMEVVLANLRDAARVLRRDGRAVIQLPHGRRSLRRVLLPERVRAVVRAARGADRLKNDPTWGGVGLLSHDEIVRVFTAGGLRIDGVHPDPTHEPGTRVVVVSSR